MHNFCISMDKAWHLGITVIYAAVKTYPSEEFEVYNFDFTVLLCDPSNYGEWNLIRAIAVHGTFVWSTNHLTNITSQCALGSYIG